MFSKLFGGSDKEGSGPEMPSMGKIMSIVTGFMNPLSDKRKITEDLVKEFATDANIKAASAAIMSGIQATQAQQGRKFVLSAETTMDNTDLCIRIYTRIPYDPGILSLYREVYLSQLTQSDIYSLINLMFNGTNDNSTGTKRIG